MKASTFPKRRPFTCLPSCAQRTEGLPVRLVTPPALPALLQVSAPRVQGKELSRASTMTIAHAHSVPEQIRPRIMWIVLPVIRAVLRAIQQETPILV